MRDPSTFETRLAEAFDLYASGAPIQVDSAALAVGLANRQPRRRLFGLDWSSPSMRLVLVAALLGATLAAALLGAGMKPNERPLDATSERLMVWLPTGDGGAMYLFDSSGELRWSGRRQSGGCPMLLPGSRIAVPGIRIHIETDDGRPVEDIDTGYEGYERWAPDRRAIVLVDTSGPISVMQFGQATVRYGEDGGLAGAVDVAVSNGGTRVVVAVRTATGVDLHLLDGRDTVIYRLEPFDAQVVNPQLMMAPDGSRVALVYANTTGRLPEPHVVIVSLPDGAAVAARPEVVPSLGYDPVSWSPDGSTLALLYGGSVQLYDAATGVWRDSGWNGSSVTNASRWRNEPGAGLGIAMFDGSRLDVFREGVATGRRVPIAGAGSAFSPDGTQFAFLEGAGLDEVRSGRLTRISAVDVWGDGPDRLIATLPEDAPPFIGEPCLDWQPGEPP